jgi:hypothetical protein
MCFGSTSETSSTTKVDPVTQNAKYAGINQALSILNQSYPGYDPNAEVAPLNADQNTAFQQVRDYASSPVNIASERVVDQNGRLGSMSDYIDPYISNALAPAIRDLQTAGQQQRNDIGSSALMSGAFGDARHGIAEGQQMKNENQQIADLTSTAYSNAYQNAMAARAADLDRFQNADVLKDQASLNRALSLLGVGDEQQQNAQQLANAKYQEFLQAREWPFRQLDSLTSLVGGTPTAQTTTTSQPDNSIFGAIGSVLGSLIKGK